MENLGSKRQMNHHAMPKSRARADMHFATAHLEVNMKRHAARAGVFTLAGQLSKFLVQFIATVILARILTPADFGLAAMIAAVTNFLAMFKDLGLSTASIQSSTLDHPQSSNLFWINIAVSAAFSALAILCAEPISAFYHEPQLAALVEVAALGLLISGTGIQHDALLKRQMRFHTVAAIEVGAATTGAIAAVAGALLGLGVWALLMLPLVTATAQSATLWLVCTWRPTWPTRAAGTRDLLRFGGNMTLFNLVNYFARNLDSILIGRVWGASAVGYYSRAYALLLMPATLIVGPITSVATATLCRMQDTPARFREYYLHAFRIVAYITLPLIVVLAVLARDIIVLLLGPQWEPAVILFQLLAIAAIVQPIGSTVGWIYSALGNTARLLKWGLVACPLLALSFVAGLTWGAEGVATAYGITVWLLIIPQFYVATRGTQITLRDIISACARPALVSIIVGGTCYFLRGQLSATPSLEALLFAVAGGAIVFATLLAAWKPLRLELSELLATTLGALRQKAITPVESKA